MNFIVKSSFDSFNPPGLKIHLSTTDNCCNAIVANYQLSTINCQL